MTLENMYMYILVFQTSYQEENDNFDTESFSIAKLLMPLLLLHIGYYMSSPTRGSSFFFGKVTALGVLCCSALLFV